MSGLYAPLYHNIINNLNNQLLQHFLSVFYNRGDTIAACSGTPDISGYTLIFLMPPTLSGLSFNLLPSSIITSRNSIFQALEFTPPESTISYEQIQSGANNKIPFATGKSSGGQMSITYLENMRLDMYAFHNNWFHYIEQVLLGYIDPSDDYIISGELDYASSAFVMRFKPDLQTIVYLGKAVGIFPVNLPNKEIIGSRQQTQLTTYTVQYVCTDYREIALTGTTQGNISKNFVDNMWVLADFVEAVKLMYGDINLGDIGSILVSNLNDPTMSMVMSEAASGMI